MKDSLLLLGILLDLVHVGVLFMPIVLELSPRLYRSDSFP